MPVTPFEFPLGVHVRRHGPYGYETYAPYRDWLRDEFCFRCAFCLNRELWDVRLNRFHIDHFVPQANAPELGCVYDNLLYVCARCNSVKSDIEVPDPCKVSFATSLRIKENGEVLPLDDTGVLICDLLNLNEKDSVRYRKLIIDTLGAIAPDRCDEIIPQWLGFPEDLPDLSIKKADNTKKNGIQESYYEQRRRGELPATY